jgi:hypothetical protein
MVKQIPSNKEWKHNNDILFLKKKSNWTMLINDTNIKSFRMTKVFRENTERINACDFNKNGLSNILISFLLYIWIFNRRFTYFKFRWWYYCCLWLWIWIVRINFISILTINFNFRPKRPIPSKKYGCDMIRFTRSGEQALHCSMKVDGKHKYFIHQLNNIIAL